MIKYDAENRYIDYVAETVSVCHRMLLDEENGLFDAVHKRDRWVSYYLDNIAILNEVE